MSRVIPVRPAAVVLDLGEVLASPPTLIESLAARVGCEIAVAETAYWHSRDAFDRGADAAGYWTSFVSRVGGQADEQMIKNLRDIDSTAWTTIRTDSRALLRDLQLSGVRVAILSNAPFDVATRARHTSWSAFISDWFFSAELGIAKPDSAIFAEVARRLLLTPPEIAFIDDRPTNVSAAAAVGWKAHLWVSSVDSRGWLTELGLLR